MKFFNHGESLFSAFTVIQTLSLTLVQFELGRQVVHTLSVSRNRLFPFSHFLLHLSHRILSGLSFPTLGNRLTLFFRSFGLGFLAHE